MKWSPSNVWPLWSACVLASWLVTEMAETSNSSKQDKMLETNVLVNEAIFKQVAMQLPQPASPTSNTAIQVATNTSAFDYLTVSGSEEGKLAACHRFFYEDEHLNHEYKISEVLYMGMIAKHLSMVYTDVAIHRYDSYEDLKASNGQDSDQDQCVRQLGQMVDRADKLRQQKYTSRDLNIFRVLDVFGRPPAGFIVGSTSWLGHYEECLHLEIEGQTPSERLPTRYCHALVKLRHWPKSGPMAEDLMPSLGVCLPKSCDSTNYKNKFELIKRLVEFNFRQLDQDEIIFESLYCLPEEDSPLRSISQSPKSLATACGFGIWIAVLIYATIKYELYRIERKRLRREARLVQGLTGPDSRSNSPLEETKAVGLSMGFDMKSSQGAGQKLDPVMAYVAERERHNSRYIKIYKSLSIINNLKLLFNTSKVSSLMSKTTKDNETAAEQDARELESLLADKPIIDLRALEGIKVICMAYVIMGHVLMCLTMCIKNGRDLAVSTSPSFFIANLVPAFAVNSFFTVTGLLTSYLLFKQNKSHSLFGSPLKWLAFMLYRYLRIMPMYIIVILYTKFLSRYAGSGPLWDYGTSATGQRQACENEPWLWTLLFGANFKPPLEHCIPSAWYLANDFQFFMVTPIFLSILHSNPKLGKRVLSFGMLAGYLAGFWSIINSDVEDLRPVARFMPHGFKTYVSHLSFNYTRPQYRIPAYFCGLLVGFLLHNFEQDKLGWLKRQQVKRRLETEKQAKEAREEEERNQDQLQHNPTLVEQGDSVELDDEDIPLGEDVDLNLSDSAMADEDETERQDCASPDINFDDDNDFEPNTPEDGKTAIEPVDENIEETKNDVNETDEVPISQDHKAQVSQNVSQSTGELTKPDQDDPEPIWSPILIEHGTSISLLFISLCCVTPLIGSRLPFNKFFAKLMVAFIMPSYHVLFSISIGIYLLLATTGHANKLITGLLSASLWKPFARLSLCAVLLNVEVINYLVQTNTETQTINTIYQFSFDLFAIVCTYIVATITCVLFEAPMRAALNHLLGYFMGKLSTKKKRD